MKFSACVAGVLASVAVSFLAASASSPQALPREWIDADTGHRVVRLSDAPGSQSLYFNYNAYTPQGDKMVISTPNGIAAVDLKTHALHQIVSGKLRLLFAGRKTRTVYYESVAETPSGPKTVYAANIDTGIARVVARIPRGSIQSINSDETLLAGIEMDDEPETVRRNRLLQGKLGKSSLQARLDARIPMNIFTLNLRTGERNVKVRATDWLNHLQFSPTDPGLLLYCHEGPWHRVDRIWLLRTDRADAKPVRVHTRTMRMEIAGHEWFSRDGRIVWYDLQTPRGEDFWVAGYVIDTGARIRYHLNRDEWSVHFNSSPDGTMFSGDGGDAGMVAHAPDGKWLYLFRARPVDFGVFPGDEADVPGLIRPGVFTAEKLVNMKNHDYRLEPNANFTPDGKWLVFRSNMLGGASQVYAVELSKEKNP